ncbi:MAG: hypothetical protein JXX14_00585 [Deltaproteobacteria bacterium]|nr:hypothetical protein [Deltaproteobacteria bacterium]
MKVAILISVGCAICVAAVVPGCEDDVVDMMYETGQTKYENVTLDDVQGVWMEKYRRTADDDAILSNQTATERDWVSVMSIPPEMIFIKIKDSRMTIAGHSELDQESSALRQSTSIYIRDGQFLVDKAENQFEYKSEEDDWYDYYAEYTLYRTKNTEISLRNGNLLLFEHENYLSDAPGSDSGSKHVQSELVPYHGEFPPADWPPFQQGWYYESFWADRDLVYPGE